MVGLLLLTDCESLLLFFVFLFGVGRLLDMRLVSFLEVTSTRQQIDRDDNGEQDVDGREQDGLQCRNNQLREQEEAACERQNNEDDSRENRSSRNNYVDVVDGLGRLSGIGGLVGIDILIHNATSLAQNKVVKDGFQDHLI